MNPLLPIITAGALYTTPIVPPTYYVSNLSETDGSKCGEYISITQMPAQIPLQTLTPPVIPTLDFQGNNSQE